jgi:endonuclease YncB( thermonuclease family)
MGEHPLAAHGCLEKAILPCCTRRAGAPQILKSLQAIGVVLILTQGSWAWDRLSGCKLLPNESNDGDSFHVEHEGKEYIFRLYFVDTPESSMQVESRVAQQADDFGVSEEQVLDTGHAAAKFTEKALRGRFEVLTRFENALGASRMGRSYAVIKTPQKEDLGMLLVKNGLARAHGVAPDAPGSYKMTDYKRAEERARRNKIGVFGGRKLADAGQDDEEEEIPQTAEQSDPPPRQEEEISIADTSMLGNVPTPEDISDRLSASIAADTMAMATMGLSQSSTKPRTESSASTPTPSYNSARSTSPGGKVSVNNATKGELESLPKIGPKMAQAIIDGRPYEKVSDIERVPGLGGQALQMILPLVTE